MKRHLGPFKGLYYYLHLPLYLFPNKEKHEISRKLHLYGAKTKLTSELMATVIVLDNNFNSDVDLYRE